MHKITVIGAGYVGLVSGVGLADFGHDVTCVDKDAEKIRSLQRGQIPFYEPGLKEILADNVGLGRLRFGDDVDRALKSSEVVFIAVGTPAGGDGAVDLGQVTEAAESIARNLDRYTVIVTKSTVPVGTNRWLYSYIREKTGEGNFDVVSNPEFLREGRAVNDFFNPDKVVIGFDRDRGKEILKDIYRSLNLRKMPFMFCGWEEAELIKYAANAFLATKITFINQIADLCEKAGVDIHVVANALGMDGRIGPKFLHPGPGYGGSCLPKDTRAVVHIGRQYGVDLSLIGEVVRANELQKKKITARLVEVAGAVRGKTVGVLGVAFKAGTDDIREAPALSVIDELLALGATVRVHDPKALESVRKVFGDRIIYCDSEYDAARGAVALLILTEWNEYRNIDLDQCRQLMTGAIILDFRNVLDPADAKEKGFAYYGRGRR